MFENQFWPLPRIDFLWYLAVSLNTPLNIVDIHIFGIIEKFATRKSTISLFRPTSNYDWTLKIFKADAWLEDPKEFGTKLDCYNHTQLLRP
jgi:hypothetical protein